ncbi:hypothetical protein K466DRAFT_665465 [Polyporus arcularius HHB13444]|uniref:F-box domain-containing protein n=1 Tax=Polyporus arcularius HHB13444 TaxID=1314778 RepID=A0A5C3P3D1_9APHY|nr:hypothetical protein K466DRAFT_665465 [Polyporus arcularius HHB13444]
MASPCLNYDVLLDIIARSDSHQTGLAIMSTCRLLRQEGAKVLLRKPIWLDTEERLVSFLSFLLKEPKTRPQRVRKLVLSTYDLLSEVAEVFGVVFQLMISLDTLDMSDPETMIDSHPDLVFRMGLVKSLTSLKLSSAGLGVYQLLMLLRAPLKTLSVCWLTPGYDCFWEYLDEEKWPRFHPTILLGNFAETLEELTCDWWYVGREYEAPRKTYTKMRRLAINECSDSFILAPFIQAFPNLTHVSLRTYRHELGESVFDDFRDNHELNVAHQHAPPSAGGGVWQHIQEFSGHFVEFYILGLACHVRRLILEDSYTGDTVALLAETLSQTCPEYFEFSTCSNDGYDGIEILSAGLREASAAARSRLNMLVVNFRLKCPKPAMENLASAIRGIPLQLLKFVRGDRHDVTVEEFDFAAFAETLFCGMSSLEEVVVSRGRAWEPPDVTSFDRNGLSGSGMSTRPISGV